MRRKSMLKIVIFIVCGIALSCLAAERNKEPLPEYDEEKDGILMLHSNDYKKIIYNSDTAWLVDFYSKWCGHCKAFASTYKELAQNMSRWNGVVRFAAVDCIDKGDGYDNGLQMCFRPPFFVSGMPDLRFIPANTSDEMNGGIKRSFQGKKVYGSDGRLISDSDSFEHLLNYTIDKITENIPSSSSIKLKCLKKNDLENVLSDQSQNIAIIVEAKKSKFGRQIILDLSGYANISVYRISENNKMSMSYLADEFGYKQEQTQEILVLENWQFKKISGTREESVDQLLLLPGVLGSTTGNYNAKETKLFAQDLENAVLFTIQREIAGSEYIKGRSLQALKDYLEMLTKYYPGRKAVMMFIKKIYKDVDSLLVGETIGWSDWQNIINKAEKATGGNILSQASDEYSLEGCAGSRKDFRGFPCSLWQLFHVMSVNALEEDANSDWSVGLLIAMKEYIVRFFSCIECRSNWSHATDDLHELDSSKDAVLYLWRKHNGVNLRLSGSATDDPEHPKQQWPTAQMCPKCWKDSMNFDESEVFKFLRRYYSTKNIQPMSSANKLKDEL